MARLVGSTTKACYGGNNGSGCSVESMIMGGRKLEGKGSSQRRGSPLRSTEFFLLIFLRENLDVLFN